MVFAIASARVRMRVFTLLTAATRLATSIAAHTTWAARAFVTTAAMPSRGVASTASSFSPVFGLVIANGGISGRTIPDPAP